MLTRLIKKLRGPRPLVDIVPPWVVRTIVVSLPASKERRDRLNRYLPENGIFDYKFFDACGPSAPAVRRLYEEGKVKDFPNCFRCGKLTCGKDDCNNVLIPPQVANVVTFRRLWAEIAARDEITLVMEDDVVLHEYAAKMLARLDKAVESGELKLGQGHCGLIRLGWALGGEHDGERPFEISNEVRMSNPMYIITPDFAANLVTAPEEVITTSDIILHRDAPLPGQAVTLFPPIASDLSWSTGAIDSTIHPKTRRIIYLEAQGDEGAAQAHANKVRDHRNHIFYRPLLITGHPRTGTGFAADICCQAGLQVGHETDGLHGVSSWMMAADAHENPWFGHPVTRSRRTFHSDIVVQTVRDPLTALPSILREDSHAPASVAFRRQYIKEAMGVDLADSPTAADRACLSLCLWAEMIDEADHFFRIEDGASQLVSFLHKRGLPVDRTVKLTTHPVNANKLYKGSRYPLPVVTAEAWAALAPQTKSLLRNYCERFGYALPSGVY